MPVFIIVTLRKDAELLLFSVKLDLSSRYGSMVEIPIYHLEMSRLSFWQIVQNGSHAVGGLNKVDATQIQ